MTSSESPPIRYIGLDAHKLYLVAVGITRDQEQVYGPRRVTMNGLEKWAREDLRPTDKLVIEMSTNTYDIYDTLSPFVDTVTVVHPPHVKLVTQVRVKTDKKDALSLAKMLAANLIDSPVWVPPQEIRDLRAILAQRRKMKTLSTQAKNRLHALLHRHRWPAPEGSPFSPDKESWWFDHPLTLAEKANLQCDWHTLQFATSQVHELEEYLKDIAADTPQIPYLIQIPGFGLIVSLTVFAAIGDISRFETAKKLVGYSGLGASIHDSGKTHRTGRMTKTGRRDLRAALVEAAQAAANFDPHWQAELKRLAPRIGRNKAIVAIARKLLIAVWHILSKEQADRFARAEAVARKLHNHTDKLGKKRRQPGQTAGQLTRVYLDEIGVGQKLAAVQRGPNRRIKLPPSTLEPSPP